MYRLRFTNLNVKPRGGSDIRLAKRLSWISREAHRLDDGGTISEHYLRCARGAYLGFISTGDPRYRFSSWQAIFTCSSWLAQLEAAVGKGAQ